MNLPCHHQSESGVQGTTVSFSVDRINQIYKLSHVPIEEDCLENWDNLGVTQAKLEYVICAGVNHGYMTETLTIGCEVLAPEARTWREFVGSTVLGYKNKRDTKTDMQRVICCVVTHKKFSLEEKLFRCFGRLGRK